MMRATNKSKKVVLDFGMKLIQIVFVVIIFSMTYYDNFLIVVQKNNSDGYASNSFLSNRTDDESGASWLSSDNEGNFRIEGTLMPDTDRSVSKGEGLSFNQNISSDSGSGTPLPERLLGGIWRIDVVNGNVEYFTSNMTMVTSSGTDMHDHLIEFKSNNPNVLLLPNNTAVTNPDSSMTEIAALNFSKTDENITRLLRSDDTIGFSTVADIQTNGVIEWRQIPVAVTIFNGSEINIEIESKTVNNHFSETPIYGSVNSIEPLVVIQNGTS
jgi:hypothetical protein